MVAVADAYACQAPLPNDVRPQGNCSAGFVQVNPTLVVFSADVPDPGAMTAVFVMGFVASFGGPEVVAMLIRSITRLVKQL